MCFCSCRICVVFHKWMDFFTWENGETNVFSPLRSVIFTQFCTLLLHPVCPTNLLLRHEADNCQRRPNMLWVAEAKQSFSANTVELWEELWISGLPVKIFLARLFLYCPWITLYCLAIICKIQLWVVKKYCMSFTKQILSKWGQMSLSPSIHGKNTPQRFPVDCITMLTNICAK